MTSQTEARIQIIPKLIPMFPVPYGAVDYRLAKGGRGSGKTMTFAKMVCVMALTFATEGKSGAILCAREFVNSLEFRIWVFNQFDGLDGANSISILESISVSMMARMFSCR